MSVTIHQLQDAILYLPFLVGQFLYAIKRSGFSMRAGRAPTRRAYFYQNWDVLLFRAGLAVLIYGIVRHFSIGDILLLFHIDLRGISLLGFLYTPIESGLAMFGVGMAADGLIDWGVDWASRKENTKIPQKVKDWLTENCASPNGKIITAR